MAGAAAEVEFVAMCGGSGARGAGLAHAATAEVAAPTCAAAELLAAPAHAGGRRAGRLGLVLQVGRIGGEHQREGSRGRPRREQDREVVEEKNGEKEEDAKWGPLVIERRRELINFWHPRV